MTENSLDDRSTKMLIDQLIMHIDRNIEKLSDAVKVWNLDEKAEKALRDHLLAERDILAKFSPDALYDHVLDDYFKLQQSRTKTWENLIPDSDPRKLR